MMTTTSMTTQFTAGARVKVIQYPKAPREDDSIQGRHGEFVEYTQPHGYARVALDDELGDTRLVHPENLIAECICSVIGCGFYANDGSEFCPSHY